MTSLRILLLALLGVVSLLLVQAQEPVTPAVEAQIVRAVAVEGFQHLPATVQEKVTALATPLVGEPYTADAVSTVVSQMAETGWFFRVRPRTEPMENGLRVIFTVTEYPVVTEIAFIGNTVLPSSSLLSIMQTQVGQVANRNEVARDALRIRARYAAEGYTLSDVTDANITPAGRVEFMIFEPRIDEIHIVGNSKTQEAVIRRELTIKPGDVYNERAITRSLQNLERTTNFQNVGASPEVGTRPGTLNVIIRVEERRTGTAQFGVAQSTNQSLVGFIDLSENNLSGTGQRISVRSQFGGETTYSLSYTNPWLDNKRTSGTINLYDRTILREAELAGGGNALYNEKRKGFNVSFGRPLSETFNAYLTFRNDEISGYQDTGATQIPANMNYLLAPATVRSFALTGVNDARDSFLNPTRGSYLSMTGEFAGLGGVEFSKFSGDTRWYFPLSKVEVRSRIDSMDPTEAPATAPKQPWVLATRVMAGTISGNPPFLDQFLLGGPNTLRGYTQDRFPGVNMLLLNSELRIPLTDSLQGVVFVDAGDAWGGPYVTGIGDSSLNMHIGYGLGIRVQTPIGPLRLDYGLNGEGGKEFHFGVGSTF